MWMVAETVECVVLKDNAESPSGSAELMWMFAEAIEGVVLKDGLLFQSALSVIDLIEHEY